MVYMGTGDLPYWHRMLGDILAVSADGLAWTRIPGHCSPTHLLMISV